MSIAMKIYGNIFTYYENSDIDPSLISLNFYYINHPLIVVCVCVLFFKKL